MYDRGVARPPRPALVLALWSLAATLICQWLAFEVARRLDEQSLGLGLVVSALMGLAVVLLLLVLRGHRDSRVWSWGAVVLIATLGVALAFLSCLHQRRFCDRLSFRAVSGWQFVVESDCTEGLQGYRCRAHATDGSSCSGDVWLMLDEPVMRGTCLTCVGRFAPLSDDDYARSSWHQGVCGSVRVIRVLNIWSPRGATGVLMTMRSLTVRSLDPEATDTRALLAGCVCGAREPLAERGLDDAFAACGLAHLIAVSGSHLAVLTALTSRVLETFSLRREPRMIMLVVVTGLFVIMCGAPVSALRAWAMSLVAFGAQLAGRRTHTLSAVSLVALMMTLASPTLSGQLAFLLSVVSVVGLCLLGPHATYMVKVVIPKQPLRQVPRKLRRRIWKVGEAAREMFAMALVCQLCTLPLTAPVFGTIALIGPLANIVMGPLVTVLMPLGLLAGLLQGSPAISGIVLRLADLLGEPLLVLVRFLARIPHATISTSLVGQTSLLVASAVPVVWLAWWPRVSRSRLVRLLAAACLVVVAVVVRWRLFVPARIVVLDIGQGDAILVQDGASAVLVDAGPDDAIVEALARLHVLHLDALVVTHLHDDHYGGISDLVGAVGCDQVLVAEGVAGHLPNELAEACRALAKDGVSELSYDDTLVVGGYELRMIWPRQRVDGDENCESIELLATYASGNAHLTALLTGDAEQDETGSCLAAHDVGDIDVLKVGHHGSEVSITADQAEKLDPEIAIASAGEGNSYGHPRQECVEVLEGSGALFLCTKDVGDVEVRPGASGPVLYCPSVSTSNDGEKGYS